MVLKKKDFIEIEFTGKTKDGEIFDSNIKQDLEKANFKSPAKPFRFCLGEGMFLQGIDEFLIGKDIGEYNIDLEAEKAFGKRDPKLIKLMPLKLFKEHQMNPAPGLMVNFDGRIAKIISVSGGRVMVDFNNPVAGKDVSYKIKILKKIEDRTEKAKAFIEFLFKKDLDFEIKDKIISIDVEAPLVKFVELFKDKFQDVLDLELKVKEKKVEPAKKQEDTSETKTNSQPQ